MVGSRVVHPRVEPSSVPIAASQGSQAAHPADFPMKANQGFWRGCVRRWRMVFSHDWSPPLPRPPLRASDAATDTHVETQSPDFHPRRGPLKGSQLDALPIGAGDIDFTACKAGERADSGEGESSTAEGESEGHRVLGCYCQQRQVASITAPTTNYKRGSGSVAGAGWSRKREQTV